MHPWKPIPVSHFAAIQSDKITIHWRWVHWKTRLTTVALYYSGYLLCPQKQQQQSKETYVM